MGEYIQSNDDSGNLALYAGIGAGMFVLGSALAYRASSPKDKSKKGGSGGLIVPEDGVSYAKGSRQFALGSMAKALTFGKFGGETADKGIKNMVDSIVVDHFNQNADHYKSGLNAIKETAEAGMKTLGGDAELAKELVGKGQSDKAIINQVLKENPNSMLNEQDLSNIREKKKLGRGEGLSDAEVAQPYIDRQNELKAQAAKMKERKSIDRDIAHGEAIKENKAFDLARRDANKPTVSQTGEVMDKTPLRRAEQSALKREAANLLRINPEMGVYDVLKQIPGDLAALDGSTGVVQGLQKTAKERAQKNAPMPEKPSLAERLDAYKFQKRYDEGRAAHMDRTHGQAISMNKMFDNERRRGQLNESELNNWVDNMTRAEAATPYKTRTAHKKPNETDQELARRQNAFNQQARRKRFGGTKPKSRFKGTKLLSALL